MNWRKASFSVAGGVFLSVTALGQYQNVWAFGTHAGIDFNTSPPTAIVTSISTSEGSASICNENGQLLFYTDGFKVWDKNHNLMPNGQDLVNSGISISASTTQGALIVPMPGSNQQYYIFSLGAKEVRRYEGRLYYSVVDMSLNAGLGAVINTQKGVLLDSALSEHLTAVPGPDCDIWLLAVSVADNALNAYEININGITPNPVTSPLTAGGGVHEGILGSIAASPNLEKLAIARGNMVLYDFDINSGTVSNAVTLEPASSNCYSTCFSEDNTKLYVTAVSAGLLQFDLNYNLPVEITDAKTVLDSNIGYASIRSAGDGKIYCASWGDNALHIVHFPSLSGSACQLEKNGFNLAPGTESEYGLPNLTIHKPIRMRSTVTDTTICISDSFTLSASILNGNSYRWSNGETGPYTSLISSDTYWVRYTLIDSVGCFTPAVDTFNVIQVPPLLKLDNEDTIVCAGTVIPIRAAGTPGYQYQWLPTTGVSDPNALNPEIIALGDTVIRYTLTASYPGCPDTSQSLLVTVDSPFLVVFRSEPTEVCVGSPVNLYPVNFDGSGIESLLWNFSDTRRLEPEIQSLYQHTFDKAGQHPVRLYSNFRACPDTSYTDSITVHPLPEVDLGDGTRICMHGQPVYLRNLREAPSNPHRQVWSTGDTTEILKVVHPGLYTLRVTAEPMGCTTTESIEIKKDCFIDIPNAFTPNGDGSNDYFFPRQLLGEGIARFHMQVFNRWGQLVFESNRPDGRGWDGRFNEQAQPMGVYLYRIESDFKNGRQESYEGNVTLLR